MTNSSDFEFIGALTEKGVNQLEHLIDDQMHLKRLVNQTRRGASGVKKSEAIRPDKEAYFELYVATVSTVMTDRIEQEKKLPTQEEGTSDMSGSPQLSEVKEVNSNDEKLCDPAYAGDSAGNENKENAELDKPHDETPSTPNEADQRVIIDNVNKREADEASREESAAKR